MTVGRSCDRLRLTGTPTSDEDFQSALHIVDNSGVVALIHGRLDTGLGRPRRRDVYGVMVAGQANALRDSHTGELTSIVKVLNGFTSQQRVRVGLEDWTEDHSYDRVSRLLSDLAPAATVVARDPGVLDGFADTVGRLIVDASIPHGAAEATSVAIDGTDIPTWARCHFTDVPLDGEPGPSDQEAEYRARPTKTAFRSLGEGPDGRAIYTVDVTARVGHHSATSSRSAGFYTGYEAHLVVSTRDAKVHDPVKRVELGPKTPRLVRTFALTEAGAHRPRTCRKLIGHADRDDWPVRDVIADRGMTTAPMEWQLPLRASGYVPYFDLVKQQRGSTPTRHGFLIVDGWPHTRAMPPRIGGEDSFQLPRPPIGATSDEKQPYLDRFEERSPFAWRVHQQPDETGAMRFRDPFSAGRLRCPGIPASMRLGPDKPLVPLPPDWCARDQGVATVQAMDLPLFQPVLFGTRAHDIAYLGRRQAVESANSGLKKQGVGTRGHFKVFGRDKLTLLLAFEIAAYNIRVLASFQRQQRLSEAASKPTKPSRAPRRVGTYSDILAASKQPQTERSTGPP